MLSLVNAKNTNNYSSDFTGFGYSLTLHGPVIPETEGNNKISHRNYSDVLHKYPWILEFTSPYYSNHVRQDHLQLACRR
jgi:hypothetical protein